MFLFLASCAQFTAEDKFIKDIELCSQNQKNIPVACQQKFKDHTYNGQFIEFRSKYIGDYIGSVTIEVKTGEKSVMCKTPVNEKNLELLKAMKSGETIQVSGIPVLSTTFKSSNHSYITLEPCTPLF